MEIKVNKQKQFNNKVKNQFLEAQHNSQRMKFQILLQIFLSLKVIYLASETPLKKTCRLFSPLIIHKHT